MLILLYKISVRAKYIYICIYLLPRGYIRPRLIKDIRKVKVALKLTHVSRNKRDSRSRDFYKCIAEAVFLRRRVSGPFYSLFLYLVLIRLATF